LGIDGQFTGMNLPFDSLRAVREGDSLPKTEARSADGRASGTGGRE
jgi:hypothetical protein